MKLTKAGRIEEDLTSIGPLLLPLMLHLAVESSKLGALSLLPFNNLD